MRNLLALLLLFVCFLGSARADSPLTSTYFADVYVEYGIVQDAMLGEKLTDEILAYLIDDNNLIDVKAALINALGWSDSGEDYPILYEALQKKYGHANTADYSAADLMCLAYMKAMDDYFDVEEASGLIILAEEKMPSSLTDAMIGALIRGQVAFDQDWCSVWRIISESLATKREYNDMKTAAVQAIVDYMILYKPYCE